LVGFSQNFAPLVVRVGLFALPSYLWLLMPPTEFIVAVFLVPTLCIMLAFKLFG